MKRKIDNKKNQPKLMYSKHIFFIYGIDNGFLYIYICLCWSNLLV